VEASVTGLKEGVAQAVVLPSGEDGNEDGVVCDILGGKDADLAGTCKVSALRLLSAHVLVAIASD